MSVMSHLIRLKERHETLSRTIEDEQRRPGADDLRVAALKREKMQLKEEITRLSRTG